MPNAQANAHARMPSLNAHSLTELLFFRLSSSTSRRRAIFDGSSTFIGAGKQGENLRSAFSLAAAPDSCSGFKDTLIIQNRIGTLTSWQMNRSKL